MPPTILRTAILTATCLLLQCAARGEAQQRRPGDSSPTHPVVQVNQDTLTVQAFLAKPAGEQIDIVIGRLDVLIAILKRDTDVAGKPKPTELRNEHMGLVSFVDNLFFNTNPDGKTVVDDAALDRLMIYFDRAGELQPRMTVSQLLTIFLNRELQNARANRVP